MAAILPQHLAWAFLTVHMFALFTAGLSRSVQSRTGQSPAQWLFFSSLAAMAMLTVGSIGMGQETWIVSGSTVVLMVITAIWDGGNRVTA